MVILLLLVPLAVTSAGCGVVLDRVDDLRDSAEQATDRVRFCLALTRTVRAIESGSPDTAAEAAEEALATAPSDIADDAQQVVEALRRARDGQDGALNDPGVREAAQRLEQRARALCDPTAS